MAISLRSFVAHPLSPFDCHSFQFDLTSTNVQVRKRKPFSTVRNFLESQLELLRGVIPEFSELGSLKTEPEPMQIMLKEMLRILAIPENFEKMFQVRKSRDLVVNLLELELTHRMDVSRALFAQCVAGPLNFSSFG